MNNLAVDLLHGMKIISSWEILASGGRMGTIDMMQMIRGTQLYPQQKV